MKITEDYMGNVFNGEKVHGLKRVSEDWGPTRHSHPSFCGVERRWSADDPLPVNSISSQELAEMTDKITCRRCRSILGLSNPEKMEIRGDYTMEIGGDYMGNVFNGRTVHGLKRSANGPTPNSTFCGCDHRWSTDDPSTGSTISSPALFRLAKKITCKRCRSILGLSNELKVVNSLPSPEKPDYYLVLDTGRGDNEPNAIPIAIAEDIDELKEILCEKVELIEPEYVNDNYKVVGVKEIKELNFEIIFKGYDVILTKQ